MFTHVRCGGNLVPIPRPAWATSDDFARCDRCNLPGVIGVTGPGAQLTMDQVEEIRHRFWRNGETQEALAAEYGVRVGVVQSVCNFTRYRRGHRDK